MNFKLHERKNGSCAELVKMEGRISDAGDILNLVANAPARSLIIPRELVHEDFFDLKTGLAGEILQKCSNYSFKLALTGDFSSFGSKSLEDFMRESNRGGSILFMEDSESVLKRWLPA